MVPKIRKLHIKSETGGRCNPSPSKKGGPLFVQQKTVGWRKFLDLIGDAPPGARNGGRFQRQGSFGVRGPCFYGPQCARQDPRSCEGFVRTVASVLAREEGKRHIQGQNRGRGRGGPRGVPLPDSPFRGERRRGQRARRQLFPSPSRYAFGHHHILWRTGGRAVPRRDANTVHSKQRRLVARRRCGRRGC